ncbi:FAD-dependent oxidoreductase [Rubrivirga sp. IMCC45206]|uniref:FAD-dependent oxidoreductase n=1 Tax=Rubrivirga sp. IMCC45206 TaxID=3391614 RepID=UPI00398FBA5A
MDVLVLGAGVSGLSTALRLLEAGHAVEVRTRELPGKTVSAVAAAIWYPYRAAPVDRVLGWGEVSLREFVRLSTDPATGVVLRDGLEIFRERVVDPWWAAVVPGFRRAEAAELPPGYRDGYALRLPVVDMSVYLGWLARRVEAAGGRLVRGAVASLNEVRGAADAVVNCTGLAAREVARDPAVYGVRGQIRVVRAPGVTQFLIDDTGPTYVIPRVSDVVLGGTADEHVDDATVDSGVAAAIRERCERLVPALAGASVLTDRVGIRPCRSTVRLEVEDVGGTRVVHNYGHGGSGVTLSWGCAEEVVGLV